MSFEGKVVIVTGSSAGIGASTAIQFAKEGAQVIIVGTNEVRLRSVKEKCEKFGKTPLVVQGDIAKGADGIRIIDETVNKFGRIDVLVNNAGIGSTNDITNKNFMEGFDHIMNVNLRGVVFITHQAIPHLIKSEGNIVNISSITGIGTLGIPTIVPYCVSMAGLNHFTRSTALNLASYGVRANKISPGPVRKDVAESAAFEQVSETTALKRVSDPEEIADLILFMASDRARGITGSNFVSDNGVLVKN